MHSDEVHMPSKTKNLVIFGTEDFAEIAYEYFTHDSEYRVVGFTVDNAYKTTDSKFGLPVVPFEDLQQFFPAGSHEIFCAIVYARMNKVREEVCLRVKQAGYRLASYVSSRAFVWHNVKMGEHCFIFEDNTIQPFVEIGNNVVMWSGNHIGHHSKVGDHIFITSQVVVSGWCDIGDHCFIGVNTTLANNTSVGNGSWIGHGTCLGGAIPEKSLVKAPSSEVSVLNEAVLFRTLSRASKKRNK